MFTGEIQRRNECYQQESDRTLAKSGFHHQITEECIDTIKNSAIFRLPIQHQKDVDYSTSGKNFKIVKKGKASIEKMVDDRMELINKARTTEGLTLENADYLNKATRNSTQKTYNSAWKKWTNWCRQQDPRIDATQYNVMKVIEFMLENKELSSQTLNGIRSAIASVWKVLHPLEIPLADQEVIRSFFEAKRKQEVRIPSQEQLMTWDTDILLKNIKKKWLTNGDLDLYELQKKAILLLSLATMARPGSDIGRLQKRDVIFEENKKQISGITLHFRLPKEAQVKSVRIGLIDDPNICPVQTVHTFVERSAGLRSTLPESHTLWLAYINQPDKVRSIKQSTVSKWIKDEMNDAGIDTSIYKTHSIRSASSTKAIESGQLAADVQDHVGWSKKTNTMDKYYYKPTAQKNKSTKIVNSIFFNTENNTTSEVETEAIEIVLGTTCNSA